MDLTPEAAYAWARDAATAARRVPATGAEAEAWTVRGWAEVAAGCTALGAPAAFRGLDDVIERSAVTGGGLHAARLRTLRARAGRVPPFYPADAPPGVAGRRDRRPGAGRPVGDRGVRPPAGDPCPSLTRSLVAFCDAVWRELPAEPPACGTRGLSPEDQLAWGRRYRPSPASPEVIIHLDSCRGLVRRAWMRLPYGPALIVTPRTATPVRQRIWRGVHEGAHLDHLAATSRNAEFGDGLLAAEAYAMAVEILAVAESLIRRDTAIAWWLTAGLLERVLRLPGPPPPEALTMGTPAPVLRMPVPAAEFGALPLLARWYVTGPLALLAGAGPGASPPPSLTGPLRARWARACSVLGPAAELTARARAALRERPGEAA